MTRWRAATVLAAIVLLILTGCGGVNAELTLQRHPSPLARVRGGHPQHIAVIVMENKEYRDIVGSRAAPYINGLARRYALATMMFAVDHPSLPNYLALTGGSTFRIVSDCTNCFVASTSIADQFERFHVSWKAYMEDLPYPCFKGESSGGYAKKHDPFIYYTRTSQNPSHCKRIVPLTQLVADEQANRLPRFIWITPNLCHDMHDCGVSSGDRFLSQLVPPLLRKLGSRGLLVLTWDEGSSSLGCCALASGGHIATVLAGPAARPGARFGGPVDQYSVLQMVEDLFGLRRLRGAGCKCTTTLLPLLAH
jgi:hypothetical protein